LEGRRVFIVDGHEDIASNALHNNHDVRLTVSEIRTAQSGPLEGALAALPHAREQAMIGLPELRLGGVGLVFATIFTFPSEPEASTKAGLDQLFYYHDLARQDVGVRLIRSVNELDALVADWNAAPTPEERPVGMLLLMENADPISKPTELYEWVNGGLRIVGPAWRGSRYAGGTGEPGPLTALGRGLLGEMQRLGIILDISHLAEESFWQALDLFTGPVIASHANCRVFTPTDRHLSDEMIRALIARDAVIGTVLANKFLDPAWEPGAPLPLDVVIRHVDHICELAGDATHCALGSDFDGGFGAESTPDGFDSVADLGKIADTLSAHGYTSADIESIMGGAWLRLLRRSLPAEFEPVSR
jgi:membrane dipeptidase